MNNTYDGLTREMWHDELNPLSAWNTRHLMAAFAMLGIPATMLDVGCGDGTMVNTARALGCTAYGVDQLVEGTWGLHFFHHNLVDLFKLPEDKQVNMVICLEVAEHLHFTAHPTLCDTFHQNLLPGSGNFLIFSAAFPNQGGMGHVSERPSKYWLDELSLRGFNYRKDITVQLSLLWSNINSPLYWLASNVMLFEK